MVRDAKQFRLVVVGRGGSVVVGGDVVGVGGGGDGLNQFVHYKDDRSGYQQNCRLERRRDQHQPGQH